MDKAKAAVGDFLHKHGQKDTTVHENVAPAITKETIRPEQHEQVTTAVDKEVHQDHYHTSVQPVKDKEILPEQHTHQMAAAETRHYKHGDAAETERRVAGEANQFKDERVIQDTKYSQSAAPVVGGEHVHHHVHETIQPVVQKETIQPNVVHTTVPIHEVHHNEAQHHGVSQLPTMTMDELKQKGGTLTGREQRTDHFEGEPRGLVGGSSGGLTGSSGGLTGSSGGLTGSSATRDTTGTTGSSGMTNPESRDSTGLTNPGARDTGAGLSSYGQRSGTDGKFSSYGDENTDTTGTKKASMMDKLNPKVDADGDGKAGFMK